MLKIEFYKTSVHFSTSVRISQKSKPFKKVIYRSTMMMIHQQKQFEQFWEREKDRETERKRNVERERQTEIERVERDIHICIYIYRERERHVPKCM